MFGECGNMRAENQNKIIFLGAVKVITISKMNIINKSIQINFVLWNNPETFPDIEYMFTKIQRSNVRNPGSYQQLRKRMICIQKLEGVERIQKPHKAVSMWKCDF